MSKSLKNWNFHWNCRIKNGACASFKVNTRNKFEKRELRSVEGLCMVQQLLNVPAIVMLIIWCKRSTPIKIIIIITRLLRVYERWQIKFAYCIWFNAQISKQILWILLCKIEQILSLWKSVSACRQLNRSGNRCTFVFECRKFGTRNLD